ncbi:MAG: hypothetical protein AAF911_01995 [Planctomycetota bacterium]
MGHNINGFIAEALPLKNVSHQIDDAVVCELPQGYGFLPLPFNTYPDIDEEKIFDCMDGLSRFLCDWACQQSLQFTVVYIETEYFAGPGRQSAVAWHDGEIAFGPAYYTSEVDEISRRMELKSEWLPHPINHALRLLKVDRGRAYDEFDAITLGLHRSNERWIKAASG